jgi:hypothetical protein
MGMTYRIDRELRVVRSRGSGTLTTRDLQDYTSRLLVDPAFDADYRSLADLSEVTVVDIDQLALSQTAWTPSFNPGTRRAIIAPSDLVYGLARMFATHSERFGQVVHVFRHRADAEAWLGLPDSAAPSAPPQSDPS